MIYDDVNATEIIFIQLHTFIGMVLKFYTLLAPNRQPDKRIKKSKVKKKTTTTNETKTTKKKSIIQGLGWKIQNIRTNTPNK